MRDEPGGGETSRYGAGGGGVRREAACRVNRSGSVFHSTDTPRISDSVPVHSGDLGDSQPQPLDTRRCDVQRRRRHGAPRSRYGVRRASSGTSGRRVRTRPASRAAAGRPPLPAAPPTLRGGTIRPPTPAASFAADGAAYTDDADPPARPTSARARAVCARGRVRRPLRVAARPNPKTISARLTL